MRELSAGLGVIQFMFMAMLAAILIWLALGFAAAALVAWTIFHVATTVRSPAAAVTPPAMSAAAAAAAPAGMVPVQVAVQRERTNWPGVAAALLVAAAALPLLLGNAIWLTVTLAALGAISALIARNQGGLNSTATSYAVRGAGILGVALIVFALFGMWANRHNTLYGEPWDDRLGTMLTIAELQAQLPCIGDEDSPAAPEQDDWQIYLDGFVASASCYIRRGEDALPAVFVQAESPVGLSELFASGVLSASSSRDNHLWVQRDGAVAVITADEESSDLAQNVGVTWISLNEKQR